MGKESIYEVVTEKLLQKLKEGRAVWTKPWRNREMRPLNLASGRPYRGFNALALGISDYSTPFWGTFKQISDLGGRVRKGEHGTPILFAAPAKSTPSAEDRNPAGKGGERFGSEASSKIVVMPHPPEILDVSPEILATMNARLSGKPLPAKKSSYQPVIYRFYKVFNAEQCEGLELPKAPVKQPVFSSYDATSVDAVELVGNVLSAYKTCPEIKYGGNNASYSPQKDLIRLPEAQSFFRSSGYVSTLFHELVHSTGHQDRLKRKSLLSVDGFGSHEHSKEELVAEMGAAFLCGELGIESEIVQSAAYLSGWLKALGNNPQWIVSAASQAEAAADYILGRERSA